MVDGISKRLAAGLAMALLASVRSATATELNQPALPTFALTAPAGEPSPWAGLYVGTEVFAVSGGKGVGGGFGGGGFAGYRHELDNNWVVGIEGGAGYAPSLFSGSRRGFDYADVEAKVGYDMGRLMPFVTVGGLAARPSGRTLGGLGGTNDAVNDLFNASGDLRGYATVGAGFAYQLTPNTTVELAVQSLHGNGAALP
ncbi:hypothetical protein P7D22_20950 [Lichenihabitans sp. Uapishka_5]|uniref:outer membrane protein n=1 Tax=Lichenihabitans sp. Uapishka_5 TaxID=3037302 RepID=UPI0029E7D8FB|nr:hypothetical protein [Lichenihabitans sp. Uapishka_5]MDX7953636.1 hypothetical protein [Lichenihabitans sp. Uapishka_5]